MNRAYLMIPALTALLQLSAALSAQALVTVSGTIDASLPAGNRITDTGVLNPASCGLTAPVSYNSGLNYQVYEIRTPVSEALQLSFSSATFDPFAALYCTPYNPASPQSGLLFADDDSGGYPLPNFSAANNILLSANTSYYLVISSYSNTTPSGSYTLTLGGSVVIITYPLSVTINGSGSGNVNSVPGGIACTGGTCNASYNYSTVVELHPSPSISSVFTGWSGACTGSGACSVPMTAARNVTATFGQAPAKIVGGSVYPSLQEAYNAAVSGDVIQLYQGQHTGTFTAASASVKSVKIKGGYDAGFSTNAATSTLPGKVSIGQSRVTFEKVNVK